LVFVAYEFENNHEKTDKCFHVYMNMFEQICIHFEEAYVIDGRIKADEGRKFVAEVDVIWLSGGNTSTQFGYFQKYGQTI